MQRTTLYVTSFFALVLLSVTAIGIGAAVDTPRTLMSPVDFTVAKRAIESETRVALSRCRDSRGSARELCKAQARAEERVKKADLNARYHGTVVAAEEARLMRAKAHYEVAKARCGDRLGEERIDCLRAAREDRNKSLAHARLAST
ncbi:MAG TPA: hypothetical protein VFK48_00420 [Usitatibacter sp.]|nr:hypothetical protein [Usitatibacter sp.]